MKINCKSLINKIIKYREIIYILVALSLYTMHSIQVDTAIKNIDYYYEFDDIQSELSDIKEELKELTR